ncbi:hypothetical protein Kisp01_69830 [Kineosporia sp. NBRC 101677]|nr:hypothetical protein Kisp01_69830 [Kineosporia sp. NBRC 101677]
MVVGVGQERPGCRAAGESDDDGGAWVGDGVEGCSGKEPGEGSVKTVAAAHHRLVSPDLRKV